MLPIACASAAGVASPEFRALAGLLCPKASPNKHPPFSAAMAYRLTRTTPSKNPMPRAIATAVRGFRLIAASVSS